jgi:Right handed beta helix region
VPHQLRLPNGFPLSRAVPNPRILVALVGFVLFGAWAGAARAATYYVSPAGSDAAKGTSPKSAWKTIGRVNAAELRPGDRVLFRGGDVFGDSTLMPHLSGTASAPIVFGSYGRAFARLHHAESAVWFAGLKHVTFERLDLTTDGTNGAVIAGSPTGGSTFITITDCRIHDTAGIGISSPTYADQAWTITRNRIANTGDSGIIMLGSSAVIRRNAILDTGTNSSIGWDKHGIYMKGRSAVIVGNVILHFQANGVSLRSSNALVARNTIRGGQFGVAYFDMEAQPGKSFVLRNDISNVRTGFYFAPDADNISGGHPIENFVIRGNTFIAGGDAALDVTGGRFSSISILRNQLRGGFSTPIAALAPLEGGRYVEQGNTVFGSRTFAWNGSWLAYAAYRSASGQGQYDRFYSAG